jgi:phosphoglycolate phosphatase-like HAD superfamily hydrolase
MCGVRGLGVGYPEPVTTIILFDIDQTLLYSGGAGSLAMGRAFEQLYGIEDGFRSVEFSGRTDWGILRDAMRAHGLLDGLGANGGFRAEMARFQKAYYSLLPATLNEMTAQGRVMPGVPELLADLSKRDGVALGLATGNFRKAAFIKIEHFGIGGYLSDGGFGDDAEDRAVVVGKAIERVGSPFLAREGARGVKSVWVIGDTPLDVSAAHANGAKALGVATGSLSTGELLEAEADEAVEDLSDTDAIARLLTE